MKEREGTRFGLFPVSEPDRYPGPSVKNFRKWFGILSASTGMERNIEKALLRNKVTNMLRIRYLEQEMNETWQEEEDGIMNQDDTTAEQEETYVTIVSFAIVSVALFGMVMLCFMYVPELLEKYMLKKERRNQGRSENIGEGMEVTRDRMVQLCSIASGYGNDIYLIPGDVNSGTVQSNSVTRAGIQTVAASYLASSEISAMATTGSGAPISTQTTSFDAEDVVVGIMPEEAPDQGGSFV